ncbi:hypothetical protein [[Clostridium] fimetarium]|uniref:Uncharacterized protein n=1 Tax=[Clostridium] fimetarium TaxID=99656 RepID=A0A1I0QCV1_9FIRM|nr:hypothetical protein [[Clostridium] fimetarium]SEW24865.1 hypothetical protein SAMN05421659_107200 [[Clostridium] fimetarium]
MANLDPRKLMLINEFKNMASGKSSDEILPLVLAMSKKSNSMGLQFSTEEMHQIVNTLSADLAPAEKKRIDMMMNMMSVMKK